MDFYRHAFKHEPGALEVFDSYPPSFKRQLEAVIDMADIGHDAFCWDFADDELAKIRSVQRMGKWQKRQKKLRIG